MSTSNPHNQGQGDAASGKPSTPPNSGPSGTAVRIIIGSSDIVRKMNSEDADYKKGYDNGQKQRNSK